MKVGVHAGEDLALIIERKKREIERAGFAMWGYGGNSCHPTTMVQPFARTRSDLEKPILLCMHPMKSNHFAEPVRAEEFSTDGLTWQPVPAEIDVLGSRYALCVKNLTEVQDELELGRTQVALGNSMGRRGSDYIKGRVDKACLEFAETAPDDSHTVEIGLVAELVDPYAVFLRN